MSLDEAKREEPTIGKLVVDAQRDISSLISNEIKLAKSELKVSVKAGGTGIGLFAGAAFMLLLAVIIFSIFLAELIHWNGDGLDRHWCYLIVFGLYVLVAAILGFLGLRSVKKVKGPEKAIAQAKETKTALKRSS
ncbi:phage holin family protein [Nocardioides sp. JQ2195]|uniref:phage holin family protein n=1 Tax=Nocardioides sp. JQ2195 TaxID=2592334 RepID=UPI00143E28A5|nr:phage holin family protein [Nocardioides sp. JQ2195]QIX28251.1 phage holin family protein [Nocardioides sp. JQ2195]